MSTHENGTGPDTAALARWMRTWIGEEGQIRGFHNHSVWGTNPATFIDFTSGHQAFSAPATAAFAEALARRHDERALAMWRRMMRFQAQTVQPDGQFRHIGFQVGESATAGLIHNMAGCIGLLEGLRHAGHLLEPGEVDEVVQAVRANLDACRVYGGGRPTETGTVNQEYARVWATTPGWQQAVAEGSSTLGDQFQPLFERIADWIEAGYTTADDVAIDSTMQEANFIAGDVGIYPMGSWFSTTLAASPPAFEVGVFSPPVENASDHPGPMGATLAFPYMVWQGSENVDAASQLVEYLVSDEAAIATQAEMDFFIREGLDTSSGNEYAAQVQEVTEQAPSFAVPGNQTVGDHALPVDGFNPKFTELVQGLWQGRTPADVTSDLTTWYEAEKQA